MIGQNGSIHLKRNSWALRYQKGNVRHSVVIGTLDTLKSLSMARAKADEVLTELGIPLRSFKEETTNEGNTKRGDNIEELSGRFPVAVYRIALASAIKTLQLETGITLKAMVDTHGIARDTLPRLLRGGWLISTATILKLCDVFKVTPGAFWTLADSYADNLNREYQGYYRIAVNEWLESRRVNNYHETELEQAENKRMELECLEQARRMLMQCRKILRNRTETLTFLPANQSHHVV